jgi:hypothetical protein
MGPSEVSELKATSSQSPLQCGDCGVFGKAATAWDGSIAQPVMEVKPTCILGRLSDEPNRQGCATAWVGPSASPLVLDLLRSQRWA